MINAKELRIGNYIRSNPNGGFGEIVKVHTISKHTVHVESLDGQLKNLRIDLDRWNEPILLTPEILEKCYWYDVKNGIPLKHAAYLKIIPEIKEAHVHKTENQALFILPCEFVHQFQNIYFIFSGGDELEINL